MKVFQVKNERDIKQVADSIPKWSAESDALYVDEWMEGFSEYVHDKGYMDDDDLKALGVIPTTDDEWMF